MLSQTVRRAPCNACAVHRWGPLFSTDTQEEVWEVVGDATALAQSNGANQVRLGPGT